MIPRDDIRPQLMPADGDTDTPVMHLPIGSREQITKARAWVDHFAQTEDEARTFADMLGIGSAS